MASTSTVPLSSDAQNLLDRLIPRIHSRLAEVERVPVSILLWGPGIDSTNPIWNTRTTLRDILREKGHAAVFSEELCDPSSPYSIRLQQLAQAQEFDLVVSIPCTPGSIGEIHDFAADRRVNGKVLVFLNNEYMSGYSSKSLTAISTILSCQIEYYPNEKETEIIRTATLSEVQRIREVRYLLSGRF